jgi:hypothetical protein
MMAANLPWSVVDFMHVDRDLRGILSPAVLKEVGVARMERQ